jgi:hypothetical protein
MKMQIREILKLATVDNQPVAAFGQVELFDQLLDSRKQVGQEVAVSDGG